MKGATPTQFGVTRCMKSHSLAITVDIEDWYHKTFLEAKSFTKTFI